MPPTQLWKTGKFWRWLAIIGAGFFLLSTIRAGQAWDGDAELFILGALNILHGESYSVTQYIVNPEHAIHPAAYPPGLPMLLAPLIGLFGIDYAVIKFALTSCYAVMLAVVASIAAPFLSEGFVILLVISLGLNPVIWHFKDIVFSELPFMLFAYLGLLAFDRLDQAASRRASLPHLWVWAAACAAAITMAYEVRAIGVVLFAAVAVMSIWRFRRIRYFGPAALVLALSFSAVIGWMFPADLGTYASYYGGAPLGVLNQIVHSIYASAAIYMRAVGALVAGDGSWSMIQTIVVTAVLILSAIGMVLSVMRRLTIYEVFLMLYIGALLVYPITEEPVRYALPTLPLVFLYFLTAVERVLPRLQGGLQKGAVAGGILMLLYVPQYAGGNYGDGISVDGPEARELYAQDSGTGSAGRRDFVRQADDYCAPRPAACNESTEKPDASGVLEHVEQTEATWMIELITPLYDDMSGIMPQLQEGLEATFENRLFRLYGSGMKRLPIRSGTVR